MKYLIKRNKNIKLFLILIIILIIFFIICYNIYYNIYFKEKEGFSVKDINSMFNNVNNITTVVKNVPQQIKNVDDKLTKQVKKVEKQLVEKTEKMGNKIQEKTIALFTEKIGKIFKQLGEIFNNGIVKPILGIFTGIGNIFLQLFKILKEIGNKIVSLPNCIFTYAISSAINILYLLYKRITPGFLKNIFSAIYNYTLRYLFNFVGYITGYNANYKKCYGFNVSSQIDKMNSNLRDIQSSFKNDFGRLDFSKIKI